MAIAEEQWLRWLTLPTYSFKRASHVMRVHPNTVRWWFYRQRGEARGRAQGLVPAHRKGDPLSYYELVEAAFVSAFRKAGVKPRAIRAARKYLVRHFGTNHPFSTVDLQTDGVRIFHDLEGEVPGLEGLVKVEASMQGQERVIDPISDLLYQFDYDQVLELTVRWFPRGKEVPIVVDPRIRFGDATLFGTGVSTWAIWERHQGGESVDDLADDYEISPALIERAIEFERLPAAGTA
jgi:uncharacterized protein (DUF433 family)